MQMFELQNDISTSTCYCVSCAHFIMAVSFEFFRSPLKFFIRFGPADHSLSRIWPRTLVNVYNASQRFAMGEVVSFVRQEIRPTFLSHSIHLTGNCYFLLNPMNPYHMASLLRVKKRASAFKTWRLLRMVQ